MDARHSTSCKSRRACVSIEDKADDGACGMRSQSADLHRDEINQDKHEVSAPNNVLNGDKWQAEVSRGKGSFNRGVVVVDRVVRSTEQVSSASMQLLVSSQANMRSRDASFRCRLTKSGGVSGGVHPRPRASREAVVRSRSALTAPAVLLRRGTCGCA